MKPATQSFAATTLFLSVSLLVGNLSAEDIDPAVSIAANTGGKNANAKAIQWSDLAPEQGRPFVDPFAKLSSAQIGDLGYVVRVRQLIADEKIDANGEDAKEAAALASELEQQGVNIGWLMVQRERVRQIRGLQVERVSNSIAESLRNQRVSLTGFVIPVTVNDGRLTEFFLVPTLAACSHEDPPPRLQVVFVATEPGIAPPGRRTPVRVTGTVVADVNARGTVNASGQVMVHSAYAMLSPEIKQLQTTRKSDG